MGRSCCSNHNAGSVLNFKLEDGVVAVEFGGIRDLNVTGNDEDNYIIGNNGDNKIYGGAEDDVILVEKEMILSREVVMMFLTDKKVTIKFMVNVVTILLLLLDPRMWLQQI